VCQPYSGPRISQARKHFPSNSAPQYRLNPPPFSRKLTPPPFRKNTTSTPMSLASPKQKHLPPPSLRPPNWLRKRFPSSSRNHLFIIQIRTGSVEGIHWRKPYQWIHPLNIFLSQSSGPVCKKERQFPPTLCRLSRTQQDHEKGSIPPSSHFRPLRFPLQSLYLHQDRPLARISFGPYYQRRRMENHLLDSL